MAYWESEQLSMTKQILRSTKVRKKIGKQAETNQF